MPTPEQIDLEAKLGAAAKDRTQVPIFLSTLIDAMVIVPGFAADQPGGTGRTVSLAPLLDNTGKSVQPFYSSEDRLQETIARAPSFEQRFVVMRCRDLWQMTLGAELVLNPHSTNGKLFVPKEVGALLSGSAGLTEIVVDHSTTVLVGRPANIPAGMEDALRELFGQHPGIVSAYLGWKVTQETGDESYLLVIVGAPNIRGEVNEALGKALVYFSQSHPVDVSYPQPGDQNALASIDPFYVKEK